MSGRRTGGGTPQGTIRRIARRNTLLGLLDARRTAEQDIVFERYVRPRGPGGAIVAGASGNGQERYVANPPGRTFKPGAIASIGSSSGEGGDFVIAGPPGGRRGARPASKATRPYSTFVAPADANQYAFGLDGVNFFALLYSDGTLVSLRATIPVDSITGTATGCILSDESETVGVGSLLARSGNTLQVWDVEENVVYSYSAPTGWRVLTEAYYQNGALYWFEGEDIDNGVTTSFQIRLRTSLTNLTEEDTVQTVTRDIAGAQADLGGSTIEYFLDTDDYSAGIMVDLDGAVVYFSVRPQDGNGERTDQWRTQFRFTLAGGGTVSRAWESPEKTLFSAATLNSTSFAVAALDVDLEFAIFSKGDNATGGFGYQWSAASLDGIPVASLNASLSGTTLQVYTGPVDRKILRGASSPSVVATAVSAFDGTNYPDVMYFFGV